MPAAARMLDRDQRVGGFLRGFVILGVASGVVRIEIEVAHRRGARGLTQIIVEGLPSRPSGATYQEDRPDIAAIGGDLLDREAGRRVSWGPIQALVGRGSRGDSEARRECLSCSAFRSNDRMHPTHDYLVGRNPAKR